MSKITLPAAINLSYWLYKVHPEVFNSLLGMTKRPGAKMGALGDDGSTFLPGISVMPADTTAADIGNLADLPPDVGTITTSDISSSISPDLASFTPELSNVSFVDTSSLVPISDQTISDVNTAAGSTDPGLSSGAASNIGSVASVLTAGLGALAAVTTAIYKAGSPQAATISTQQSRAQAGYAAAPITYGYNTAGQLVPVLQTGVSSGVALSPQTLASLGVPSSWGPYVIPVGIGVIVLIAIAAAGAKK